ncbi:MAG: uroporphyrinogen decarboxylase family protein [Candidatus Humimicrobiaceae bacterium]
MTRKERITLAFQNKQPDRVPVSPELWDVIPIKVSGRPFYEYSATSFGKLPLWRAQLEAYKFFECEAWIPVEPGMSQRQKRIMSADSYFLNPDLIKTDVLYKTSKGNLKEVRHSVPDYDMWSLKRPVEDLFEDMPKYEEFFFDDPVDLDYETINEAFRETGDDGLCEGIVGNTFFEFLTLAREGGAVQVIFDLNDNPDFFIPIQKRYTDYLSSIAEQIIKNTDVDGIFLNCGSSVLTVISPEMFKMWDLPLIKSIGDIAKKHGKIFHYHLHGRGRAFLELLVDAGVNMICPLEKAPKGDFDLREVKQKFGSSLALKGNIDPFFLIMASAEEIDAEVKKCIEDAGKNGGFTLASADGVLKDTPFENIKAMVGACRKYGIYR